MQIAGESNPCVFQTIFESHSFPEPCHARTSHAQPHPATLSHSAPHRTLRCRASPEPTPPGRTAGDSPADSRGIEPLSIPNYLLKPLPFCGAMPCSASSRRAKPCPVPPCEAIPRRTVPYVRFRWRGTDRTSAGSRRCRYTGRRIPRDPGSPVRSAGSPHTISRFRSATG